MASSQGAPLDLDKLKQRFDLSHFGLNAVIRGIQLTLVGGESLFAPSHTRLPYYLPRHISNMTVPS